MILIADSGNIESPAFEAASYRAQLPDLKLVQDCFEGQKAVQAAGATYLPKFEGESYKNYAARKKTSTYWNAYRRTVMGWVGMVFRKNPELESDVPERIVTQLENVDLMGTHFDVFAKDVFQWAVAEGHSAILVDMPPPITAANPAATLAEERGRRPYWSLYRKSQIINPIIESADGIATLAQVTLKECVMERKGGFGEEMKIQYRVLRPGSWEVFEQATDKKLERTGGGETSLKRIPLAIISTGSVGPWMSRPPLLDLAYENLRLYRLQSSLDCGLQVFNLPILVEIQGDSDVIDGQFAAGKLSEQPGEKPRRVISPNAIFNIGHGGDLKYVEHGAKAVGAAQEEIKASKANIASLGLQVLLQQGSQTTGPATATENVIEWEAETSELAGMARSLEDGLELCNEFSAEYQRLDTGGSIKVNRDFIRTKLDGPTIMALGGMVAQDQLLLEHLWAALQRDNLLPTDFDSAETLVRLAQQRASRPPVV